MLLQVGQMMNPLENWMGQLKEFCIYQKTGIYIMSVTSDNNSTINCQRTMTEQQKESLSSEFHALNLTRYIQEAVSFIVVVNNIYVL